MHSMISTVRGILSFSKAETSDTPIDEPKDGDKQVLSVTWNQDWTGFIVGTNSGFSVYGTNPIKERINRYPHETGFKIAEMLFFSNIFALVGNGYHSSEYPSHKVFIWDDIRKQVFCELAFKSQVLAVKLRREHIVVVLRKNIYVYCFKNLKVHCLIETVKNLKGLCCISNVEKKAILACPGFHPGQVQVHDLRRNIIKLFKAHETDISCMSLTLDGSVLATASIKGTLIRIFNALDGTLLQELRRGIERAEIYSIAVSMNLKWVAASSDKGTIHVFRLRPNILSLPNTTHASSFSFIRGILPKYLYDNERSFAQFSLPASTKFVVGFGPDNTVLVIGVDGSFRRCRFDDAEGGEMVELEHKHFFSLPETDDTTVKM